MARCRSVLILEDEFFLADDLRLAALKAGLSPIGPFSRAQEGMQAVLFEQPDCAIIDIKLSDGKAYELVRRLIADAVPVVFVTGYGREAIPPEFRDVPMCTKPCHAGKAIACLQDMMSETSKVRLPLLMDSD